MMDLSYFLEMVDVKHRYGSNLRKYHAEWRSRSTTENFFYWLDQGEGKDVEVEKCSRERLENMQVRYLGREERRYYEVIVDKEGKLCWRKDGVRVDTTEKWRDSIHGIVRADDSTPVWAHRPAMLRGSSESSGLSSEEDLGSPMSPTEEKKIDEEMASPTNFSMSPTSLKEPGKRNRGLKPLERCTRLGRETYWQPSFEGTVLTSRFSTGTPRYTSFQNLLWKPTDQKKLKKEKKKKKKWIFVRRFFT